MQSTQRPLTFVSYLFASLLQCSQKQQQRLDVLHTPPRIAFTMHQAQRILTFAHIFIRTIPMMHS